MSSKPDNFWAELGKAAAKGIVEAFASGAGSHLADRLLKQKEDDSDAERESRADSPRDSS